MKRIYLKAAVPLVGGFALSALVGCGDMNQLKNAFGKGSQEKGAHSDSLDLTDEAAQAEMDEATASANDAEVLPSLALTAEEAAALPAYLQVVREAREYTRKLLGITNDPLKEYHAAVQAARAISSSPEEFQENIAPARAKFKEAMEAQKQQVASAKVQHAETLAKILSATQKVFMDCGDDFEHARDPRKHRHKGGKHGKGGHKEDSDMDDDHRGRGDHGKRGKGPGKDMVRRMLKLADESTSTSTSTGTSTASPADSQACKDATSTLKTLVTPAS
jgi:hypothetical protein